MSSYVGFSNGICGVAPGASFDELLCSVSDPSSKELFRMMFLNQQGMHASLVAHSASNQAIVSLLSSIDTKVQQTHDEVSSLSHSLDEMTAIEGALLDREQFINHNVAICSRRATLRPQHD